MRDIIIIIIILVAIFVGGYFFEKYLLDSGNTMISFLDELKNEVKNENFEADMTIKNIQNSWQNMKDKWNVISNHHTVDDIEGDIAELMEDYKNKEREEVLKKIEVIKNQILDVPKGEEFSVVNIL